LNHRRPDKRSDPVHTVKIEKGSLLADIVGDAKLEVNTTHHQALGRMAPGLRPVAWTEDGIIEAAELKDPSRLPFCLTVQFHPERLVDKAPGHGQIFERFIGACAAARRQQL